MASDESKESNQEHPVDFVLVEQQPEKELQIETQEHSATPRHIRRLRALLMLLGIFLGLAYLYWPRSDRAFPNILLGSYIGTISGLPKNPAPVPLYIERSSESEIFVVALELGAKPDVITVNGESGSMLNEPFIIQTAQAELRLVGHKTLSGSYQGRVLNSSGAEVGAFNFKRLDSKSDLRLSDDQRRTLITYLSLKQEFLELNDRVQQVEYAVPKQNQEIERLQTYIKDGVSLKEKAREKLDQTQKELDQVKEEFKQKQQQAKSLARQLEISQRVTAAGKLVSLARDSIERENRWIEAQFRANRPTETITLEVPLPNTGRVEELTHEIEQLKGRIEEFTTAHPELKQELFQRSGDETR